LCNEFDTDVSSPPCSGAESPRGRSARGAIWRPHDVEVPAAYVLIWYALRSLGDSGLERVLARRLPLFLFSLAMAQSKPSVLEKKYHSVMNLID
jgi:hypothetical protein